MTSYSAMAARGREAARETNKARMVKVDHYEWTLETLDPAPAFGSPDRWSIHVVADCGHSVHWLIVGYDGDVPRTVEWSWPVGKRKRCQRCPLPEPKPLPPDGERCVYEVGNEVVSQCKTRAKWRVSTVVPGGVEDHTWPLVCGKHLNYLVREQYVVPVDDGGTDVVVPFKPTKETPDA